MSSQSRRIQRNRLRELTRGQKVVRLGFKLSDEGKEHAYFVLDECQKRGVRWDEYWLSDRDEAVAARNRVGDVKSQKGVDSACYVLAAVVADVLEAPEDNAELFDWAFKAGFFDGEAWKKVLIDMGVGELAARIEAEWKQAAAAANDTEPDEPPPEPA
jgi:hypothetical protein